MMQSGSCECSKTELEMQAVPPTMTTMQETQWTDYHPIASLDSYHAPIELRFRHIQNITQICLKLICT